MLAGASHCPLQATKNLKKNLKKKTSSSTMLKSSNPPPKAAKNFLR